MSDGVHLQDIGKDYDTVTAVDQVALDLPKGTLLTLLGPSGCGKTTVLRMIAGFVDPSRGKIVLDGTDVTRVPPEKRGTAMVFQNYALFPHMTVFDNVAFGLRLRRQKRAAIANKVKAALDLVHLADFAKRYPAELSGGQQQRAALARCLVIEPRVLLLDEPFGALDRHLRESMQTELRKLQQQLAITTVLVTHDQQEALALSDYVAVMNRGRVEQFGPPREVYDRPRSRFVADFMGVSNVLAGRVRVHGEGRIFEATGYGAFRLSENGTEGEGDALLALRPDALRLDPEGLPGVVHFSALTGAHYVCEVRLDAGGELTLNLPRSDPRSAPGSRINVSADPAEAVILPA
ncbi:ABC transporter ATP-binding protein [Acuticoccus mangrovi]|uniref:ABC transporter ATP-binding protein n=1 Tax=Acuticoccus mangrovi TaxID=2796142 RepID=A0A934IPL9_9HYPH|nr:ABC transporter ATP-binding protein [Acuticoccus mangrovi]MBJ3776002.1 ABC transporter ATP-binding protein [Acuticoccus mangrovi]